MLETDWLAKKSSFYNSNTRTLTVSDAKFFGCVEAWSLALPGVFLLWLHLHDEAVYFGSSSHWTWHNCTCATHVLCTVYSIIIIQILQWSLYVYTRGLHVAWRTIIDFPHSEIEPIPNHPVWRITPPLGWKVEVRSLCNTVCKLVQIRWIAM